MQGGMELLKILSAVVVVENEAAMLFRAVPRMPFGSDGLLMMIYDRKPVNGLSTHLFSSQSLLCLNIHLIRKSETVTVWK